MTNKLGARYTNTRKKPKWLIEQEEQKQLAELYKGDVSHD